MTAFFKARLYVGDLERSVFNSKMQKNDTVRNNNLEGLCLLFHLGQVGLLLKIKKDFDKVIEILTPRTNGLMKWSRNI